MNEKIHIDLFSGIGGFALAAERVWPEIKHIFCDNDQFCQAVLKKHWPEAPIFGDIREFNPDTLRNRLQKPRSGEQTSGDRQSPKTSSNSRGKKFGGISSEQWKALSEIGECFILTGGFPCQPFSHAGRRKGTSDDRFLWPEMFRVIREFHPLWVIAENVRGILSIEQGMVFEQVCADLESAGYEVQPLVVPAVAVNAPHRRDRVWFVAHYESGREWSGKQERNRERKPEVEVGNRDSDAKHTNNTGLERQWGKKTAAEQTKTFYANNRTTDWSANWLEVATKLCSVDDGLPVKLDGFELSKSKNRAEQLKAYGNAIVPQVAEEIMRAMDGVKKP